MRRRWHRISKTLRALPHVKAVFDTGSFTKAGLELGQHQSAISHRIRGLERELGVSLAIRTPTEIRATPEGEALYRLANAIIHSAETGLALLHQERIEDVVSISASASVASRFLLQAVCQISSLGIHLDVKLDDALSAIRDYTADCSIRFGKSDDPDLRCEKLSDTWSVPVASPNLVEAIRQSRSPLLFAIDTTADHDDTDAGWRHYLKMSGLQFRRDARFVNFSQTVMALDAAINGRAVALGRTLLIEEDLAAGRLVPLGRAIPTGSSYWFCRRADDNRANATDVVWQCLRDTALETSQAFNRFMDSPAAAPRNSLFFVP